MVYMDSKSSREGDLLIDLESGTSSAIDERDAARDDASRVGQANMFLNKVWSGGIVREDGSIGGEEGRIQSGEAGEGREGKVRAERKKKGSKKPPKPPRPPKSPSLDAADQKLIREISELAMLKRARVERMKALKKMRNAKATSCSSSLWALVITVIFCIVIVWQGVFSRGSSSLTFQGSPVSSEGPTDGLISVQFYRSKSTDGPHASSLASPNIVEQVSGLDDQGEASRMGG